MFEKLLIAVAFLMVSSPAFVSAQDFFFSFDEFSREPTATVDADVTDTGSVFIFGDENFDFNQADIDFSVSSPNVVSFTGGVVFNPGAFNSGMAAEANGGAFTSFSIGDPNGPGGVTATDGRLFATSFLSPGQVPGSGASNFREGANGFLLAQLDYDILGGGAADFDFTLGDLGVVNDGVGFVVPTFASGALTVLGEPAPPPVDPPTPPPVDPPTPPPVDPPTPPPVDPPTPPPVAPPGVASDFFFSFDQGAATPNSTVTDIAIGTSGSLFIFGDAALDVNQIDLDFNNDNAAVISFTGGVVFNDGAPLSGAAADAPGGSFTSFSLLDPAGPGGVTATDGRIFATSFLSPGQVPGAGDNFDSGANGFLLAQVDFDIVGSGTSNLSFTAGDLGFVNDGEGQIPVTFGTGSFTVEAPLVVDPPVDPPVIPEPSSAILLILGAAGMAARRRRS